VSEKGVSGHTELFIVKRPLEVGGNITTWAGRKATAERLYVHKTPETQTLAIFQVGRLINSRELQPNDRKQTANDISINVASLTMKSAATILLLALTVSALRFNKLLVNRDTTDCDDQPTPDCSVPADPGHQNLGHAVCSCPDDKLKERDNGCGWVCIVE
jgi:hypothetical protein